MGLGCDVINTGFYASAWERGVGGGDCEGDIEGRDGGAEAGGS